MYIYREGRALHAATHSMMVNLSAGLPKSALFVIFKYYHNVSEVFQKYNFDFQSKARKFLSSSFRLLDSQSLTESGKFLDNDVSRIGFSSFLSIAA